MMKDSHKLHIAYATDDGYLIPTLVAISSALHWAGDNSSCLIFHILDVDMSDQKWRMFEDKLRCNFGNGFGIVRHTINSEMFAGFRQWHGSLAAYARLLLPDLLPDVDWCLYCDGDTLFTGDPLLLKNYFGGKYALIGHRDNDSHLQAKWFPAHGYSFNVDEYVCSGFLLMNLGRFRTDNLSNKCFEFISKHSDVLFPDQDALNVVCGGNILQLRDNWGQFGYKYGRITEPGCIHYGSQQPWKLKYTKHRGMLDIEYLWFVFARKICRLSLKEVLMGKSMLKYHLLRVVTLAFKSVNLILSKVPFSRNKVRIALQQLIRHSEMQAFLYKILR